MQPLGKEVALRIVTQLTKVPKHSTATELGTSPPHPPARVASNKQSIKRLEQLLSALYACTQVFDLP